MKKKFDYVKNRNIFFIFSAILMIVCLGSLFINGLNLGIDFNGGTIIQIDMHKSFATSEIRNITDDFDKSADITYAGEKKTQLIINTQKDMNKDQIFQMFNEFKAKYSLKDSDLLHSDKVSGAIGNELKSQAIIASAITIVLMMIYIWVRFEFNFGFAALIALAHDIIVVVGVYSIFRIQVNSPFIAAVLTILGFSVNDTIVVFDRIRENRKKYKKTQLADLVNDCVSQTMARSINTTLTVLLAISALYVTGVQAIQDFAFPLMVGFVSGAYSSIFIGNSLWYVLEEKKLKQIQIKHKIEK